jgi:hypothetical protein
MNAKKLTALAVAAGTLATGVYRIAKMSPAEVNEFYHRQDVENVRSFVNTGDARLECVLLDGQRITTIAPFEKPTYAQAEDALRQAPHTLRTHLGPTRGSLRVRLTDGTEFALRK